MFLFEKKILSGLFLIILTVCHISDVDECRESVDSCDRHSETCINDVGSYRCEPTVKSVTSERRPTGLRPALTGVRNEENQVDVCPSGYSYSYSSKACLGNLLLILHTQRKQYRNCC